MAIRHLLPFLLLMPLAVTGQTTDYGLELSVGYSHKLAKGLDLNLDETLRLDQLATRYSKSETTLGVEYGLLRQALKQHDMKLKTIAQYSFVNRLNSHHVYENQQRVSIGLGMSQEVGKLQFGERIRWQTTWRDESRSDYKYNPKQTLRTKFTLSYQPKKHHPRYYLSEDLAFKMCTDDNNGLYKLRTELGATYKINRHNELTAYLKSTNEVAVKKPDSFYALGIKYSFK